MQKEKKIRLTGKALKQLNEDIHERDNYTCIITGEYVPLGVKFHHVVRGANKEDKIECGVTLSYRAHIDAHSSRAQDYRERCEEYLRGIYGERDE